MIAKNEDKIAPISTGIALGALTGVAADTVLNSTTMREKSLLKDVQNIAKNIKDSVPKTDEFRFRTSLLAENIEQAIASKESKNIVKRFLLNLTSLIGLPVGKMADYSVVGGYKEKASASGINLMDSVNESGHKSLQKIIKLSDQFNGGTIKSMGMNLFHGFKATCVLSGVGLGVGVLYKLFSKPSNDAQ